jgi:hypothetical protein
VDGWITSFCCINMLSKPGKRLSRSVISKFIFILHNVYILYKWLPILEF